MFQNLYKNSWTEELKSNSTIENSNKNEQCVEEMSKLSCEYQRLIESKKEDPKRHLGLKIDELLDENLNTILGSMMATKAF